ncbi:hypothetical protein E2C01_102068 [Portunus trituberculatus]|uniref:Uncharacterized protein n=1 Tax=Portunus trituberculatus TaxID=210409 RepID=A0A5B7KHD6_PORTR|nr:hypothetical protein [Portunus trituberculatus]
MCSHSSPVLLERPVTLPSCVHCPTFTRLHPSTLLFHHLFLLLLLNELSLLHFYPSCSLPSVLASKSSILCLVLLLLLLVNELKLTHSHSDLLMHSTLTSLSPAFSFASSHSSPYPPYAPRLLVFLLLLLLRRRTLKQTGLVRDTCFTKFAENVNVLVVS